MGEWVTLVVRTSEGRVENVKKVKQGSRTNLLKGKQIEEMGLNLFLRQNRRAPPWMGHLMTEYSKLFVKAHLHQVETRKSQREKAKESELR